MAARPAVLFVALAAAGLAAGCGAGISGGQSTAGGAAATTGSQTATASTATGSGTATATGLSGAATVVTAAHVDAAAGRIDVDVSVTGPAEVLGGCEPALSVHLVGAAGAPVAARTPPGVVHCLAIVDVPIAAGQTRDFTARIALPQAHGTYTVVGSLAGAGPIPSVALSV